MTARPSAREIGRSLLRQLPLLVGLVVLWMFLWNQVTVLSAVTGVVLALLVTRVFFLPPVELSGRFHLGWAVVFLAVFVKDLVVASVQVSWQALRPRGVRHNAIVAVQLHTRSDWERSILYLHSLAVEDGDGVEAVRRDVHGVESRIVHVLGSDDDLRRLREGTPVAGADTQKGATS